MTGLAIRCTGSPEPSPRWTPFAAIPFRFKLALTLTGEATLTLWLPEPARVHVEAGPSLSWQEIEQAWFALRDDSALPARVRVVTSVVAEVIA